MSLSRSSTDPRPAPPLTTAPRPGALAAVSAGAVLAAVVVALVLLGRTGELAPVTPALFDPGVAVRYGLPTLRVVHDLAAAATVGLLVFAAWFVRPDAGTPAERLTGARGPLVRAATVAAVVWFFAAGGVMVLSAADVIGSRLGSPGFPGLVVSFVAQTELGRAQAVSALIVALAANLVVMATRVTTIAIAAGLSLLALLPLALAGHSAGTQDHMNAVDSLALHLVGACLWVGGLGALLFVAGHLGPQLPVVAGRYSRLAGWCFLLVAASGLMNALLRLGTPANLSTPYGLMVLGKIVALGLLGLAGWVHRRATLPSLSVDGRLFARLAAVELVIMGATTGLAVALSRSAPPPAATAVDPLALLLGHPAPPQLTVGSYLTAFYPEIFWLTVAFGCLGLYVAGVVRLGRRGDRWPVLRTLSWTGGCLLLVWLTSGGPALYGRLSFSAHMVQHMNLMVMVPLLLVFGAPVTLALRALKARTDDSFGPRETILAMVHSRVLQVLGHPVVAAALFISSLVVFYYTDLFELAMFTHPGHVVMTAHFLLAGYLFIWALVGPDPGPARPPYPLRLLLLLMTVAFHAFFGISLMSGSSLLAPDWFHALGQTDDTALLTDQQTGGAIAWATGDLPALLIAVALLVGWIRSDSQETRRRDRQADRDDDAELRAYNEKLAAIARRDERT